ncbi:MAG: oligosaccharide flippase family protein [Actinomycetes bacterium]
MAEQPVAHFVAAEPVTGVAADVPISRSAALLGPALIVANLASYGLLVVAGRLLDPRDYGVLVVLLALLLVGSVPSLAVQAVVARRSAVGSDRASSAAAGLVVGAASAATLLVLSPAIAVFLHLHAHWLALVATALALPPIHVIAALQGTLQGREQFGRLAVVVLLAGAARVVAIVPLAVGMSVDAVLVTTAVANVPVAIVADAIVGGGPLLRRAHASIRGLLGEVTAASTALGGLLVLSNLDLLLARHLLPAAAVGPYGAGSVISKAALWLPQAIALVVLPRLSRPEGARRALLAALGLTAAIAFACILGAAVIGEWLVRVTLGARLVPAGGQVWPFALQGAALSLVQLFISDDIAHRRRVVAVMTAVAIVVETVVVLGADIRSGQMLIGIAAGIAVTLAIGSAITRRWRTDAG